jgi:hypothetical protein
MPQTIRLKNTAVVFADGRRRPVRAVKVTRNLTDESVTLRFDALEPLSIRLRFSDATLLLRDCYSSATINPELAASWERSHPGEPLPSTFVTLLRLRGATAALRGQEIAIAETEFTRDLRRRADQLEILSSGRPVAVVRFPLEESTRFLLTAIHQVLDSAAWGGKAA